jgi:hypothetical protein
MTYPPECRGNAPVAADEPRMAFIEFDDVGEMFNPPAASIEKRIASLNELQIAKTEMQQTQRSQIGEGAQLQRVTRSDKVAQIYNAFKRIDEAKLGSPNHNAMVVIFIHGWKNNASRDSGNVYGFYSFLQDLQKHVARELTDKSKATSTEIPKVVGIYIGWRGAVLRPPVLKQFSYFDRRNAASIAASSSMTDVLYQLMNYSKQCDDPCSADNPGTQTRTIVIGHSFGGRVLEQVLAKSMIGMILNHERQLTNPERQQRVTNDPLHCNNPPASLNLTLSADLVMFLNEASPALDGKDMLEILDDHHVMSCVDHQPHPLLLAITSVGDSATGVILPAAQWLSHLTKQLRTFRDADGQIIRDRFGNTNEKRYFEHTTANLEELRSHVVGKCSDPDILAKAQADPNRLCFSLANGNPVDSCQNATSDTFCIARDRHAGDPKTVWRNTTPFWVMQAPIEFVPDHTTIFTDQFRKLLVQFVRKGLGQKISLH